MLTHRQLELLIFIDKTIKANGVAPTLDEMRTAMDVRSKASIHRMLALLEERGFIGRLHHRARGIEVLKLPRANAGGSVAAVVVDLLPRSTGATFAVRRNAQGQAVAIERNGAPVLMLLPGADVNETEADRIAQMLNAGGCDPVPLRAAG